jgi:hypothetical protein
MKLIDATKDNLTIEITVAEWEVIGGVFSMISALSNPNWEDSTGQADTAITDEQFGHIYRQWVTILKNDKGKLFLYKATE